MVLAPAAQTAKPRGGRRTHLRRSPPAPTDVGAQQEHLIAHRGAVPLQPQEQFISSQMRAPSLSVTAGRPLVTEIYTTVRHYKCVVFNPAVLTQNVVGGRGGSRPSTLAHPGQHRQPVGV